MNVKEAQKHMLFAILSGPEEIEIQSLRNQTKLSVPYGDVPMLQEAVRTLDRMSSESLSRGPVISLESGASGSKGGRRSRPAGGSVHNRR